LTGGVLLGRRIGGAPVAVYIIGRGAPKRSVTLVSYMTFPPGPIKRGEDTGGR
jgi:hypothetical protein